MEALLKENGVHKRVAFDNALYQGLFLRSALNQQNTIPRLGAQSTSPDIIPNGIEPMGNPGATLRDTYNSDIGRQLQAQEANYIYMRARNYANQRIDDNSSGNRPRLFWAKNSLLSYPMMWTEIRETPSGSPAALVANPGEIGSLQEPFIWTPQNINNDVYGLIGLLPSPGYDNQVPDTMHISDLAAWVALHGGVAWRNIGVVNAVTPTVSFSLDYDQGDMSAQMLFMLKCTNLPVNTLVSLSAGAPGPTPAIYIPPTPVATSPNFMVGISCWVPANYKSKIYANIQAPSGGTIPDGAKVELQVAYAAPYGTNLFELGHSLMELGIPTPEHAAGQIQRQSEAANASQLNPEQLEMYLDQLSDLHGIGPTRLIIVGSSTYVFSNQ